MKTRYVQSTLFEDSSLKEKIKIVNINDYKRMKEIKNKKRIRRKMNYDKSSINSSK